MGAETFREHGGENLTCLACLNASEEGIAMLQEIISSELAGWV